VDCRYIKIYPTKSKNDPTESTEALIPDDARMRTDHAWADLCPYLLEGSNLITIAAWPGEEAAHREFAHATNYRDNHPSTYRRTAHAITPYRREGTNWVNRSSAFYNSLRNRKNKFASLSRLTWERGTQWVFISQLAAKKLFMLTITWIYITLVQFSVHIKI
jgi:hypothetical protein